MNEIRTDGTVVERNPTWVRPNRWTPKELTEQVSAWLQVKYDAAQPLTWAGLAVHLGVSREALDAYHKGEFGKTDEDKAAYVYALKQARTLIEAERESMLVRERGNVAGIIFALKNHHGWRDERHMTVESTVNQRLIVQLPPELRTQLEEQRGEVFDAEYVVKQTNT